MFRIEGTQAAAPARRYPVSQGPLTQRELASSPETRSRMLYVTSALKVSSRDPLSRR
jgi:hypothetical protein